MDKIIEFREKGKNEQIKSDLTLEEAQEHCQDPETSSKTCKAPHLRGKKNKIGEWFHGYTRE